MILEHAGVGDSSDGFEMPHKVFLGGFHGFHKLIRVDHHMKNNFKPSAGLAGALLCCLLLGAGWGGWL